MAGLVAALHKDFQKSLAAADTDRARMLLRLAAALTAVNVVQPGSFLAALHSLASSALAAVQPGDAQPHAPQGVRAEPQPRQGGQGNGLHGSPASPTQPRQAVLAAGRQVASTQQVCSPVQTVWVGDRIFRPASPLRPLTAPKFSHQSLACALECSQLGRPARRSQLSTWLGLGPMPVKRVAGHLDLP